MGIFMASSLYIQRLVVFDSDVSKNNLALSIRLSTHPPVKYDCPFPVNFLRRADEIRAEYIIFGICESQRLVTLTF
jgi:hypothetical protein